MLPLEVNNMEQYISRQLGSPMDVPLKPKT
jgi:hypothetical protein